MEAANHYLRPIRWTALKAVVRSVSVLAANANNLEYGTRKTEGQDVTMSTKICNPEGIMTAHGKNIAKTTHMRNGSNTRKINAVTKN